MELKNASGLEFTLSDNSLEYIAGDYDTAVKWEKTIEAGKYAYGSANTNLETLYFGARYMEKTKDEQTFLASDLMADLTILNSGKVGEEFVKTVGHYHGIIPGLTISYPEAYEAISEKIEYLLQSELDKDGAVDVIWVVTEPGDKVVMPPNYGHVSMNVGEKPAIEVDIQKRDNPNQSDYSIFKECCGGALYRTEEGLKENPHYKIKSLRIVRPVEKPEWGLEKNKPLYLATVESPEKFEWLTHPEKFKFDLNELFVDVEL